MPIYLMYIVDKYRHSKRARLKASEWRWQLLRRILTSLIFFSTDYLTPIPTHETWRRPSAMTASHHHLAWLVAYKSILPIFLAAICSGSCPTGFTNCNLGSFCCSDNGDVSGVHSAYSDGCPPPQLFTEPMGSIVCETECCPSTGKCAFNATKIAIRVTNGNGTAQGDYVTGAENPNHGTCWFRVASTCVYDGSARNSTDPTSCGMELIPQILRLNDETQGNSIVLALNNAVSSLISIDLVQIGEYHYWKYSVDTDAAMDVLRDNVDKLNFNDAQALLTGGPFILTWGYRITAWSNAVRPAVSGLVRVHQRNGDVCYDLPNGTTSTEVYAYTDVPFIIVTCLSKCRCDPPRVDGCSDNCSSSNSGYQVYEPHSLVFTLAVSCMMAILWW